MNAESKNNLYTISVIILVYNKSYEMELLLEAFTLQTFRKGNFELIIIDDGSTDGLSHIVDDYRNILNVNYQKLEHTGNRSLNRNIGIQESKSEIILFLDGDIIPEHDFIEKHYQTIKDNQKSICMGLRNQMTSIQNNLINRKTIRDYFDVISHQPGFSDDRNWHMDWFELNGLGMDNNWFMVYSNNLSMWKNFYNEIGGFDPNFSKGWGAEDVELGYRVIQNKGNIFYNKSIRCYHIFHQENWLIKIQQLKLNLEYCFQKYLNWETELLFFEHMISPPLYLTIRKKITQQIHLLPQVSNTDQLGNLIVENTLNIGITDEWILNHPKIKNHCISNYKNRNKNLLPLLGLKTNFKDKEFDLALISYNTLQINHAFFEAVAKEAGRISKNILFVNEQGIVATFELNTHTFIRSYKDGNQYQKLPKIRFFITREGIFGNNYSLNLAYYLAKNGIEVSIEIARDFMKRVDIFYALNHFSDPEKRNTIRELMNHNYNFFDNHVPVIIDTIQMGNLVRAFGNRFLWGELTFPNFENVYSIFPENSYDCYCWRKKNDTKKLQSTQPQYYLPVGIEKEKIKQLKKKAGKQKNTVSFLWINPIIDEDCGIKEVIAAFKDAFNNAENIKLTLLSSSVELLEYNWENLNTVYNESYVTYMRSFYRQVKVRYNALIAHLQTVIDGDPRIELLLDNHSEDEILSQINECCYYIDINSQQNLAIYGQSVSPFVLNAAALGKKIITHSQEFYQDYLPPEFFAPVKYDYKSGIYNNVPLESCLYSSRSEKRHFLYKFANVTELTRVLKKEFKNLYDRAILDELADNFMDEFDWNVVARNFIKDFRERMLSY